MCLKISQNSQENTFGLRNFQKHLFYRIPLDDCFWLFRATFLKWGTANSVWKTLDEYSLSRNTNLRSTVQVHHFFFGWINFQCMSSLVYTVYCRGVLSKKVFLKICKFRRKTPVLDFFLIKFQAWHLFWRTSANVCFCTALAPLSVTYLFYFCLLPHHHYYYC